MRLCYHVTLVSTTFFPQAMPQSADSVSRIHIPTRSVHVEAYARADDLRDVEARFTDLRPVYASRRQRDTYTGAD